MRIMLGLLLLLAGLIHMSTAGNATPLCAGNNACSPTDNSVDTSASAAASATNVNAPVTVNTNTAHGGRADADATAVNFNANIAKGGNVSNSGNSSNRNKNTNVNLQGQDQSQRQRQGQEQGQQQSVDGSGNSNVNINNPRQPVNSAIAAGLTSGEDTCMGSSSIGGQGVGFGISLGTTWQDENCKRLKNARMLVNMGKTRAAAALMCQDDDVRAAIVAAGEFCPGDEPAQKVAEAPAFQPMAPIPND